MQPLAMVIFMIYQKNSAVCSRCIETEDEQVGKHRRTNEEVGGAQAVRFLFFFVGCILSFASPAQNASTGRLLPRCSFHSSSIMQKGRNSPTVCNRTM